MQQHAASFIAHTEASMRAELPRLLMDEFDAFLAWGILTHDLSLVGVDLRQCRERQPDDARRLMQDVAALNRAGRIRPLITAPWPLTQHPQACAHAGGGATVRRVPLLPKVVGSLCRPLCRRAML